MPQGKPESKTIRVSLRKPIYEAVEKAFDEVTKTRDYNFTIEKFVAELVECWHADQQAIRQDRRECVRH